MSVDAGLTRPDSPDTDMPIGVLSIEQAGVRTLLQDAGRPGYADLGVSAGGAWDRASYRLANRLVGNEPGAAELEILLGGLTCRADIDLLIAVTGAEVPIQIGGRPVDGYAALYAPAGSTVSIGAPSRGLRCYLAVRGGLLTPGHQGRLFGSLSSDPTRQMGPAPIRSGDRLLIGQAGTGAVISTELAIAAAGLASELRLHAVLGPRDDWFTPAAIDQFGRARWTVTDQTDRVGTRLSGPVLERAVTGELRSEAVVRGAVQVPASGQPLVFGPDQPTTGGYPVIAVVDGPDADKLAQAAPGQSIGFELRRNRLLLPATTADPAT